ncbi:MAG TPA: nickel transporter permease [Candidatus Methylomirabilis sp.]|nr:nickel transporter permease [Candidatus Methylomirabilis sp.]
MAIEAAPRSFPSPVGVSPRTRTAGVVTRLLRGHLAKVGTGAVLALILAAILAPQLAPHDPTEQHLEDMVRPPDREHLLGSDELGRDILSRLLYGARVSLAVGVLSVGISLLIGVSLGLVAGYRGGWLDEVIMRLMDGLLAFPALVLALAITAALGPSLGNAMIAIGIVGIPGFARLVRGQVLSVRAQEFVEAARAVGGGDRRIILRHVVPNVLAPIIVHSSLRIAFAVLTEASLSFLGLGAQPPTPSWGSMLNAGREYLEMAPWLCIAPGAAIFVTTLSFNFLGDGLRDALDPRLKS